MGVFNRAVNHNIKRFYKRGLITLLSDENSIFTNMTQKSSDATIHAKNIPKIND